MVEGRRDSTTPRSSLLPRSAPTAQVGESGGHLQPSLPQGDTWMNVSCILPWIRRDREGPEWRKQPRWRVWPLWLEDAPMTRTAFPPCRPAEPATTLSYPQPTVQPCQHVLHRCVESQSFHAPFRVVDGSVRRSPAFDHAAVPSTRRAPADGLSVLTQPKRSERRPSLDTWPPTSPEIPSTRTTRAARNEFGGSCLVRVELLSLLRSDTPP